MHNSAWFGNISRGDSSIPKHIFVGTPETGVCVRVRNGCVRVPDGCVRVSVRGGEVFASST